MIDPDDELYPDDLKALAEKLWSDEWLVFKGLPWRNTERGCVRYRGSWEGVPTQGFRFGNALSGEIRVQTK